MNYCPRCVLKMAKDGEKYCRRCEQEIRREINQCYRDYGWPNGRKLRWRQAEKANTTNL